MGIIFDYLRCDPFELNFRLLILNGFWPLDTKIRWLQKLFSAFSYLSWFSLTSMMFIQVLDLYLLKNDILNLIQNMCASTVTFASISKWLLLFFQADDILKLHHELNEFKKSLVEDEEIEIFKKAEKQISLTTNTFFGLSMPCVLAWMLYPGLDSSETKRVPFPYRLPTDDWSTPIYEILYTYQSMSMIGYLVLILSNDLVFWGFILRIIAQYDILLYNIGKINRMISSNYNNNNEEENRYDYNWRVVKLEDDPLINKQLETFLKDISIFHQQILEEINRLRYIYMYPFLIHALATVTLVGAIVVDLVLISKGFKIQLLQRMTYTMCGLFDIFVHCYYATLMQCKISYTYNISIFKMLTTLWYLYSTHITQSSDEVFRSVYTTPWYRLSPKLRRELFMVAMRASRIPKVMIGHFISLNLSTFLDFLKTSYNITTLMYQTIRK